MEGLACRLLLRLKEKKALEQSIAKVRAMTQIDDATKRQLHMDLIKWWIKQAEEEISALKGSNPFASIA
jgi:hypothetical protein